jgi:hypothetical protein
MFSPTSRYSQLGELTLIVPAGGPHGRPIKYVRRRFLPQGDTLPLLTEVTVTGGDRLDLIAARVLGDPLSFWRICDANNAMNPFALTDSTNGTNPVLRISPPQFELQDG